MFLSFPIMILTQEVNNGSTHCWEWLEWWTGGWSYGFDSVNVYNYTVLLTFPNKSSLNVLNIVSSNDFDYVLFEANIILEKPLAPGEDNPNVLPPYNAYFGIGAVNVNQMASKQTGKNSY